MVRGLWSIRWLAARLRPRSLPRAEVSAHAHEEGGTRKHPRGLIVRSDLIPGREFDEVSVLALHGPTGDLPLPNPVEASGRDWLRGVRVLDLGRVEPGTYVLSVGVSLGGARVMERPLQVHAGGVTVATILLT